jgi:GntP family gluconate:H+ symporter
MSGGVFLVVLAVAILFLMLLIIKLKVHPVMALFTTALLTGIVLGYGVSGTADMIGSGFGGTLGSVGITIILGAVISMAIEDTGAAKSIANFFIKLFRGKNMELAPSLTAFIMSIPVFGDITMVLTAPIASMLSKRKHISMSTMAAFTGLGLFLTHGLVPPTPGILAVALMFEADLGMTIVWGVIVSLIGFFGTWLLLRKWTEKEWIEPNPEMVKGLAETDSDSIDDILIKDPNLPGTFVAFLPLLLPVALISLSSFAAMYADPEGVFYTIATTIGHKVIALFIGVLYSLWLGYKQRKAVLAAYKENFPNEENAKLGDIMLEKWVARGLIVCLSPLLITAMGGAFGSILKSAPALTPLSEMIGNSPIPGILVPWAVAFIMMTAVGSMTTAGMTAAGIVLPMLPSLGISPLAAVLAIGAGTLALDHVSNSGFWVMGQFFHLNTKQSLKYVTFPTFVASVICIIAIAIFNAVGLLG